MTIEEKIEHLQAVSMREARSQTNDVVDTYRKALEKVFNDHKEEALVQSETRVKAESLNARKQLNQAAAKAQLELKREQGKVQLELKEKIFEETYTLVDEFMKTDEYRDFLIRCIHKAMAFAPNEETTIYINASDADMKDALEAASGATLTVSVEDFIGGVRAVIRNRNVLIDNSFKTQLRNEYDKFIFLGGDTLA